MPTSAPGFCKREVRECLGVAVSRSSSAAEMWENARHKFREVDPEKFPRGVTPVWLGGSSGDGHVSIATGSAGHWTTDLLRPGFFDRTGIARVAREWRELRLVGWVGDFDGVTIWTPDDGPVRASVFQLGVVDVAEGLDVVHEVRDDEAAFGWTFDEASGSWVLP